MIDSTSVMEVAGTVLKSISWGMFGTFCLIMVLFIVAIFVRHRPKNHNPQYEIDFPDFHEGDIYK